MWERWKKERRSRKVESVEELSEECETTLNPVCLSGERGGQAGTHFRSRDRLPAA